MPDRNRTTYPQSYVPAIQNGDIPQFTPPLAPPVVQASNQASPPAVAAIAFAVVIVIALAVGLAGWGFLRWDARLAFVASIAFAIGGALLVLVIVNGDFPAVVEIRHHSRTERKRIDAQSDAIAGHYEYLTLAETNRHAEETKRIEAHTTDGRLRNDVAWLVEQVGTMRGLLPLDATVAKPVHSFVPSKPDEARRAVGQWLLSLWDGEGNRRFTPGQLPMPWNSNDWRGKPWCDDARRLLLDSGILVPGSNGRTFSVVPASMRDAMSMLDAGR